MIVALERTVIVTEDGSKTLFIEEWNEQYHSVHGAVQEAYHVFIKNGLALFRNKEVSILEMGFGTGLNALITLVEGKKQGLSVHYTGVEKFPITPEESHALDYVSNLNVPELSDAFDRMHSDSWRTDIVISEAFVLHKLQMDFKEVEFENRFHLVYFDAFGARVQPELWTVDMFANMFRAMKSKGILVTYAAKGSVRRAMQEVGFAVERLPGPPGKREMLRATKP